MLCAFHPHFDRGCRDLTLSRDVDPIEFRLQRKDRRIGRITAPYRLHGGILYWFTRDGVITETAPVRPGGEFFFRHSGHERDHAVFASSRHPLGLLRLLELDEELIYEMPAGPAISFSVSVSEESMYDRIGFLLGIGDVVLPDEALGRMLPSPGNRLRRGDRISVGPVLTVEPLSILIGPAWLVGAGGPFNPFESPEHIRAMPRLPVTSGVEILYP